MLLRPIALATGALALSAAALPVLAANPASMSVADIVECVEDNSVEKGALRDLSVISTDAEGKSNPMKMKMYWKPRGGPRVHLRLVEPKMLHGSSYLLTVSKGKEEVYFYLPGADRPLKITGENMDEPLWGTDFSYGEIKQVLGLMGGTDAKRIADAKVANRPTYVLESNTRSDSSGYTKVLSYIDQQSCTLLKSEFFGADGKPRKVLEGTLTYLMEVDGYWLLLHYTMKDLTRGTKTAIMLSDFSVDEMVSEKLFQPDRFHTVRFASE